MYQKHQYKENNRYKQWGVSDSVQTPTNKKSLIPGTPNCNNVVIEKKTKSQKAK